MAVCFSCMKRASQQYLPYTGDYFNIDLWLSSWSEIWKEIKSPQAPISPGCVLPSPTLSDMPLGSVLGRRSTCHRNICTKVLLAEGTETPFTQHCRNYEDTYKVSGFWNLWLLMLAIRNSLQIDIKYNQINIIIIGWKSQDINSHPPIAELRRSAEAYLTSGKSHGHVMSCSTLEVNLKKIVSWLPLET